jgi:hypothetical protein
MGFLRTTVVEHGRTQLVSRNGHAFALFSALADSCRRGFRIQKLFLTARFAPWINAAGLSSKNLLFRRGSAPCFLAFDVLMCDGKDLRLERLADRKQELRHLLRRAPPRCLR